MGKRTTTLAAVCALAACCTAAQAANVRFLYTFPTANGNDGTGFNDPNTGPQAQAALEAAGAAWASRLGASYSNETVVVSAQYQNQGGSANGATLASAGPNLLYGGASINPTYTGTVYYAEPLYNHLTRSDVNGSAEEIDVTVNSAIGSPTVLGGRSFYYGTDGKPGSNQIDFESVVTHEIGHGLGILSFTTPDGTYNGGTIPSIYDTYLKSGGTLLTADDQATRASALVSGGLTFVGPQAEAGYGGQPVPIYAPSTYQAGSSTSHVDQKLFDLMDPVYPGVDHTPSGIDFGILGDEGWDIVAAPEPTALVLATLGVSTLLGRRRRTTVC